ncbi:MAG: hypothetical protein K2M05_07900 [Paramuribaculum sp.]|nr:hypothetical protein [Paramuribaculum sp.]
MKFISTPISFVSSDSILSPDRQIDDPIAMMDNLIELIALTPKGTFNADPDFGFEYWDPVFADVSALQFNSATGLDEYSRQGVKERCEAGIADCIATYAPICLKVRDVVVEMNLKDDKVRLIGPRKIYSHREVEVTVSAKIDDGMGTVRDYFREITFMMEPILMRTGR